MKTYIKQKVQEITPKIISWRREIHKYPELGFEEINTAKLIAKALESMGLEVKTGIAGTGVVALLRGYKDNLTVGIRADMDALPIQEISNSPYRSQREGIMHACGHDGHIAVVLGVAEVLSAIREKLPGNVKFIFQPAEEGPGGAKPLIESGVLEHPPVNIILSLHIYNQLPSGKIGIRYGAMLASADKIKIIIKGQGGHAASPHQTIDAIVVAAQVICALQTIASRRIDPTEPFVLTIGTIKGGYRNNVIADRVEMEGTVRTLNTKLRKKIPSMIRKILKGITQAMGASFEFEYYPGYPATVNNSDILHLVENSARTIIGNKNITILPSPSMGAEDFAYYLEKIPGAFIRLGSCFKGNKKTFPAHHPQFDFDERCLPVGVAVLSQATYDFLVMSS